MAIFCRSCFGSIVSRRGLARFSYLLTIAFLILAITSWIEWRRDDAILERKAAEIVTGLTKPSERVAAINHWVYANQGFAKNQDYYLLKPLGPTPIQVMQSGGDCSDRSRLVSAMLARLGIASWLVMLSECTGCVPIHTVVEAEQEAGLVVADPAWDIVYSAADGHYLSVNELANTSQALEYVAALKQERGAAAKIAQMEESNAKFDYAATINWEKNFLSKAIAASLGMIGIDARSIHRPRLVEDPELLLALAFSLLSIATLLLGLVSGRKPQRQRMGVPP